MAPSERVVWAGGHRRWDGVRYVWRAGHWQERRPGFVWEPPHWVQRPGGRWRFVRGYWRHV